MPKLKSPVSMRYLQTIVSPPVTRDSATILAKTLLVRVILTRARPVTRKISGAMTPLVRMSRLPTRTPRRLVIGSRWRVETSLTKFTRLLMQDPSLGKCCRCRRVSPSWIVFMTINWGVLNSRLLSGACPLMSLRC